MKPNLCQDRYLAAGMGLFAACLERGRPLTEEERDNV